MLAQDLLRWQKRFKILGLDKKGKGNKMENELDEKKNHEKRKEKEHHRDNKT